MKMIEAIEHSIRFCYGYRMQELADDLNTARYRAEQYENRMNGGYIKTIPYAQQVEVLASLKEKAENAKRRYENARIEGI